MWNPQKTLVLHNSRETLTRLLNRRIRHLCTTYKMQNVWTFYPKYAMCMLFPVFRTQWSKMIKYDTIWYICNALWYDAIALAYKLFVHPFSLLKSLLFFWIATLPNAQTKIANVYMREQSCDTRDDMMIPIWYGMYEMEGVDQWSLMCTSNVADNTQMASPDRKVTQNGLRG